MRALLFLACVACAAPVENVETTSSELRAEGPGGVRPLPCLVMRIDSLAPRAVPIPYGGLILATGCGFESLRRVVVHPDAIGEGGGSPVAFAIIDDRHVVFHTGERETPGSGAVFFEGRDLSQRFFGWAP